MGAKKDPDSTLPGRFGHVELELGPDAGQAVVPPVRGARSEDVTQASDRTRAAVGDPRVAAMRELYAEGDASGALFIALSIAPRVGAAPSEPPPASGITRTPARVARAGTRVPGDAAGTPREVAPSPRGAAGFAEERTVARTASQELATLASDHDVPWIRKSADDVAALPIDHRGGFLLAHIDGVQTMTEILDVCAMPEDEAVFLIRQLVAMGVVGFRPREEPPPLSSRRARRPR
ncbi:MAG: hypothetical protein KF764_22010 [Labilithrix sp.]|nr:hypothetical protein [Labilithrix sp.]MBX3223341.1 hypothetical protein [Labilithrix sp.]